MRGLALFLVALFGGLLATAQAAEEITPQRVREAISKGVDWLKQQQRPDGSWGEWPGQPGAVTSLCTLALLNSGVPVEDPVIEKALRRIRKFHPSVTYATSLQTMTLCRAEPKRDLLLIARNAKWLQATQLTEGSRKGSWSYPSAAGDNSNAQFALLALYEADQVGVEVSQHTWRMAKAYWEGCQNADGSWGYYKDMSGTGSMTAAGIASMVIVDDKLGQADASVTGDQIQCCGRGEGGNPRIERGLQWLGRNFSVSRNPGVPNRIWHLYYLYGVERVGRMTARRFIGQHDWYREGTDILVRAQASLASGFWRGLGHAEDDPEIATSFALLFLSRGRRPILMAKVKHTTPDDWNQHRSDVHNLTRQVEARWKRDLTWQVVDLKAASIDDLIQSPVLYLCGSVSPWPDDPAQQEAMAAQIRGYLERGGFLLAEAYCGGTGFDAGFRRLMKKAFPESEYALRLLPAEHPIWDAEERVDPKYVRPLWGVDFGCRTSAVYAPLDPANNPRPSLSCLWELARGGRTKKYSAKVQEQVDAAVATGVNILAYATNRELRGKEEARAERPGAKLGDKLERGRLAIATLRHPGGCSVAPRALVNLVEAATTQLNIRAEAEPQLVSLTDEALFNYPMVFIHGRNSFHLTDAERKQLKAYIERGGLVFGDAVCASRAFAESFRRELAATFPQNPLQPIPGNDPLWSNRYGGFNLPNVSRRDPEARRGTDPLRASLKQGPPALEGLKIGGRYGVIFSPVDLSCALEKQDSMECQGYIRDDAARIGLNVVLYGLYE